MALPLALYRCRDTICLSTDAHMVSEHLNRMRMGKKSPVNQLPEGSVILHNNKPYGIPELTRMAHKKAKNLKIDLNKPYSIIIDDRFIK